MISVGKIKQYTNVLDKPLSRGRQEVILANYLAFGIARSSKVVANIKSLQSYSSFHLLLRDLKKVSLSAFAFLFSELVQYSQRLTILQTWKEGLKMLDMLLEQEFLSFFAIEKRVIEGKQDCLGSYLLCIVQFGRCSLAR